MATPQGPSHETGPGIRPDTDRVIGDPTYSPTRTAPSSMVGENVLPARNRVQWGPIIAGVTTALTVFLLLTVLGFAIGASVLGPRDEAGEIGTWAAIWGAFSIIAAFFIGGWIAARTAAIDGDFAGLMQGLVTGAAGLLFIIWLTSTGLGNLFGTLGAGVGSVLNVAGDALPAAQGQLDEAGNAVEDATGVNVDDPAAVTDQADEAVVAVQEQAGEVAAAVDTQDTFDTVRNSALGTFLALLLPLLAAALGGWIGKYDRQELIQGTGAA